MGKTTIFNQLVINIVLPVMAVLMLLAFLNYQHTKSILIKANENKNEIVLNEIKNILQFQDFSLEMIESGLDQRMEFISNKLVSEYIDDIGDVASINLDELRDKLEMDTDLEDIYIINSRGVVVNATFKDDIGLDVYAFGEEYKNLLESIRNSDKLHLERFSIEAATGKLKKFSYQGTKNNKYIVELGFYSHKANKVLDQFKEQINNMSKKHRSIENVDLFIGNQKPISFNQGSTIDSTHMSYFKKALNEKITTEIIESKDGKDLYYDYIYMSRKNSDLYDSAIIRVISDRSEDERVLREELITFLIVFGITVLILIGLILKRSRTITMPIITLVDKANKIKQGDLSERVSISGNNEITTLSESFNLMLEKLEESYRGLENKVVERTKEIVKQKDFIEEQNRKITDSIYYAKRIQTAILPSDVQLQILGKEHFVFFRPMNIVSGDFYWVSAKDDKVLVSAADCTGHGVPGAFMSMIGNTLLNKIVNENNITQPHNILSRLRDEIIDALNQAKDDNLSKDGMDMSICAIDFKNMKLEFSGANNPLFLVRNKEAIEYKPNKQPVGMLIGGKQMPFTNHVIDIKKGDCLYLFSDGFQDQFGGEDGKKFMKKRFKELLEEISEKPMKEQHDILEKTIIDWIKNTRQIDDILVMGIRI